MIAINDKIKAIATCFLHAPSNVVFSSLKQLFIVMRAAEVIMGVPAGDLANKRVKLDSVVKKDKSQYIVLLHLLYPGLLEVPHWITESVHASNMFKAEAVGHMPESLMLDARKFLRTFQIQRLQGFARDVVCVTRVSNAIDLLVDPFAVDTSYVGCEQQVISCKGISLYKEPVLGQPQLVPHEVFVKRFHEFTCGVFEGDFPWNNAYVAGGALKIAVIEGNLMKNSDVDIFIVGENSSDRKLTFGRVLTWFEEHLKDATFCTIGSVTVIASPCVPRIFQVINSGKETITQVLADFDTTCSAWTCFGNSVKCLCLPEAVTALKTRVASFLRNSNNQETRCVKALLYGYNLSINSLTENAVTVEEIMSSVESSSQDASSTVWRATKEEIAEAMVARYKTGIVSDNAMAATTIIGDDKFVRGYTSVSFTTLDTGSVDWDRYLSYNDKPCRTTNGKIIKLTVKDVQVIGVGHDGIFFKDIPEWRTFSDAFVDGFRKKRCKVQFDCIGLDGSTRYFSESMATKNKSDIRDGSVCDITFRIMGCRTKIHPVASSIVIVQNPAKDSSSSSSQEDTPF
jgi:hypothetical protein